MRLARGALLPGQFLTSWPSLNRADYGLPKTFASKGPLLPRTVVLPSKASKPLITPSTAPSASDAAAKPLPASKEPTKRARVESSPMVATSTLEHTLTFPSPSTFSLLVKVPAAIAAPPKDSLPPPSTALQLLPPRTLVLALPGAEKLSIDVGRSQVDLHGLEAEWRVAESELRVSGRLTA